MSWSLTVLVSAGMIALGTVALLVSPQRALRPLACATACAGMAMLFASLARDRGDATGLLVAWLILGVWSIFAVWSWHIMTSDGDHNIEPDHEQQAP